MFPKVYSGTGFSGHRVDHWTWIWMRKRPICFFTHHLQNSWTSPPSCVLNFVKEFLNQSGVSKTLAIMGSFPHKLTHYHADFQCFVTVMNSVLLQGVFIFLPHSQRCWGQGVGGGKKKTKTHKKPTTYKCTSSLMQQALCFLCSSFQRTLSRTFVCFIYQNALILSSIWWKLILRIWLCNLHRGDIITILYQNIWP